jgi:hypothetical protein
MNITRIGPVAIPRLIEPTSIEISGNPDPSGAVPIKASFSLASRQDAELLEELVNNPARRHLIAGQQGNLEWVETADALARWRGWWHLLACDVSLARRQIRKAAPDAAYVPVSVSAVFIGTQGQPVVVATHRDLPDDFAVAGQAMLAPVYPSRRVEGAGAVVTRASAAGAVDIRKQSTKRGPVRIEPAQFDPSVVALRPGLRDAGGVMHYGPRRAMEADGARLETAHLRVTIGQTAANHWLVEGWIAGAWYTLGALRIRRTAAAGGHAWNVAGTTISDDRVSVLLVNDYDATILRAEVRVGELGMRVIAGASYYLQWLTAADAAAGTAVKVANVYEDQNALGNGARRFIALASTELSQSLADWQTQIDVGDLAMIGFVPPAPGADDTSAEQGKQFLFDRVELLTLE